MGKWKVTVKTSPKQDGGTHAQVTLTVYGSKGNSGPQPLGKADPNSKQFEPGAQSDFTVSHLLIISIITLSLLHLLRSAMLIDYGKSYLVRS